MIEIKANPSKTELRVFAVLLGLFFAGIGRLTLVKPHSLLWGAAITGVAVLVWIAFNPRQFRKQARSSVSIPSVLFMFGCVAIGPTGVADPMVFPLVAWIAGGVMTASALLFLPVARFLYAGWMEAAIPLGWTFSHAFLAIAYYLVLTPIGLLLRLFGHDAMHRQIDPAARSYWIKRDPAPESSRYLRQF